MLFRYLYQKKEPEVIEYLIKKLYSESATNIDYYLS